MSWNNLRGATEWALMVGLVFGAGAIARAAAHPEVLRNTRRTSAEVCRPENIGIEL